MTKQTRARSPTPEIRAIIVKHDKPVQGKCSLCARESRLPFCLEYLECAAKTMEEKAILEPNTKHLGLIPGNLILGHIVYGERQDYVPSCYVGCFNKSHCVLTTQPTTQLKINTHPNQTIKTRILNHACAQP